MKSPRKITFRSGWRSSRVLVAEGLEQLHEFAMVARLAMCFGQAFDLALNDGAAGSEMPRFQRDVIGDTMQPGADP